MFIIYLIYSLVPTEISPPKKQATPPRLSTDKSPSLDRDNTSFTAAEPVPEAEQESESQPVEPVTETEAPEPMAEDLTGEPDQGDDLEESTPAVNNVQEDEPKNNSHGNDFENDEDSQGQNIVQDFISRTVQDLSHDDSEDIQG